MLFIYLIPSAISSGQLSAAITSLADQNNDELWHAELRDYCQERLRYRVNIRIAMRTKSAATTNCRDEVVDNLAHYFDEFSLCLAFAKRGVS